MWLGSNKLLDSSLQGELQNGIRATCVHNRVGSGKGKDLCNTLWL